MFGTVAVASMLFIKKKFFILTVIYVKGQKVNRCAAQRLNSIDRQFHAKSYAYYINNAYEDLSFHHCHRTNDVVIVTTAHTKNTHIPKQQTAIILVVIVGHQLAQCWLLNFSDSIKRSKETIALRVKLLRSSKWKSFGEIVNSKCWAIFPKWNSVFSRADRTAFCGIWSTFYHVCCVSLSKTLSAHMYYCE